MKIIKYLLSSSYRKRVNSEYTRDICSRLDAEDNQRHAVYDALFGKK